MTRLYCTILSTISTMSIARGDRGQTTAEYALVLLGSAAIAMLILAWATQTNKIGKLLDTVLESVIGLVA